MTWVTGGKWYCDLTFISANKTSGSSDNLIAYYVELVPNCLVIGLSMVPISCDAMKLEYRYTVSSDFTPLK